MPPTERRDTLTAIRVNAAAERAAATRRFLLATQWADGNLDPEQPQPVGECLCGCVAAHPDDLEHGDFGGGCAGGCVGDSDGFSDPFIPVVNWHAAPSYAAAVGRTTTAGSLEIRDALLPGTACRGCGPAWWRGGCPRHGPG